MLGVLLYLYFLVLGFLYVKMFSTSKNNFYILWMGGLIGNLILMAGIAILSFIFGFNIFSHVLLIILSALPLIITKLIKKNFKTNIESNETSQDKNCMNMKTFMFVVFPFFILIGILLTNHILVPTEDGGYASGQSTYGDLNMHIGFVTSIAEQGIFPPNYVFLSGEKLNYPFFINMLSSSLYLFGTSIRWAILIPSYIICLLLIMGLYFVGYKISNKKAVAILSVVLFLLCGGFGFSYFMEGSKADTTLFTRIFTDYYHTPTNYNEHNIRWANSICDMIIPQRTTMAGWCFFLVCLWLLLDALNNKKRSSYILLGIIAGCMPMIHTHSFLAFGIISAVIFFFYLFKENSGEDRIKYIVNWIIYGAIVVLLAFPQLYYWTFSQAIGNSSFLRFHFNWVNQDDPYLWFYIKNFGIIALFIIPAVLNTTKENRSLFYSSLVLFIIAELILFQPNEYDNNKLFFIVYMIWVVLVSEWLVMMWNKLEGVKGRYYLAILIIILGTFSGILTIGREMYSGGMYNTFSKDMIEMSEYIKNNTPKDATFLTSTTHINPVCSLAGRNVYLGSSLYVYFHGFGDEYEKRSVEIENAYQASYEDLVDFCIKNDIEYIYVGDYETNSLQPNMDTINRLDKVAEFGSESLYKVN